MIYYFSSLSFFLVYLRLWTLILLFTAFVFNLTVLSCVGTELSITIILGTISIFVPNGYLLYNFAGTLLVDLPQRSSKVLFLTSTLAVNSDTGDAVRDEGYHHVGGHISVYDRTKARAQVAGSWAAAVAEPQ